MPQIVELNQKHLMREAKSILNNKAAYIIEAYRDEPFTGNPKVVEYSKDYIRSLLSNWKIKDYTDGIYDYNFNNPAHKSQNGDMNVKDHEHVDDNETLHGRKDNQTNSEDSSSNFVSLAKSCSNSDALRMMKYMYFTESEDEYNIIHIDQSDFEQSMDTAEEFAKIKLELKKAQTENLPIHVELGDDSFIELDIETINKLLTDDNLIHLMIFNLHKGIEDIADILGVHYDPSQVDAESSLEESTYILGESTVDVDTLYEDVKDYLDENFIDGIVSVCESTIDIHKLAQKLQYDKNKNNKNRIVRGKAALVNRVRGGKLQMRKLVSATKGYKIKAGVIVRMKPSEIKKRKISAKFASKKRRNQQSRINRRRKISLRLRNQRIGN